MKSIKVIIDGVETNKVDGLTEEQAQFIVGNFLSVGYPHKISETITHVYPTSQIKRIEIEDSLVIKAS